MKERLLDLDLRQESSAEPKRERLKNHFVNEIVAGRLRPGQMLPSDRCLEKILGIARMTVSQAMASLEIDGLIRRVPGKGTFVEDDVQRKLPRGLDIFALVVLETHRGFYPSLLHGFEAAAGEIHHQTIILAYSGLALSTA
jgi:GntR family transcriptional regulator, arabinose operon transcriptional repressor